MEVTVRDLVQTLLLTHKLDDKINVNIKVLKIDNYESDKFDNTKLVDFNTKDIVEIQGLNNDKLIDAFVKYKTEVYV